MMLKKTFAACLFCGLLSSGLAAQTLKGVIVDKNTKEGIMGAAVSLTNLKDTLKVMSGESLLNGGFKITEIPKGDYTLRVMYLGYEPLVIKNLNIENNVQLDSFFLSEDSELLKEVVVEAKIITMQEIGDTTQYNAGAFKTNPDATAEDLLKKMPGFTVENGKVKAKGEDIKRVTVDGKTFFGEDATAALKNLPANTIDKVQLFDESNTMGFLMGNAETGMDGKNLNFVTKNGLQDAWLGHVKGSYGTNNRYNADILLNRYKGDRRLTFIVSCNNINNFNFSMVDFSSFTDASGGGGRGGRRRGGAPMVMGLSTGINTVNSGGINYSDKWGKKVSVSMSYFINSTQTDNQSDLNRTFFTQSDASNQLVYTEQNKTYANNLSNRFNATFSVLLDSFQTLTIAPQFNLSIGSNENNFSGLNRIATSTLSNTLTNSNSQSIGYRGGLLLRYARGFRKPGRAFSIDLNTTLNNRSQEGALGSDIAENINTSNPILDTLDQQNTGNNRNLNLATVINYSLPVHKDATLSFNYSSSYAYSFQDKLTNNFETSTGKYRLLDTLLSNKFANTFITYKPNISYRWKEKEGKFTLSLGATFQLAQLAGTQTFPSELNIGRNFYNFLGNMMFHRKWTKTVSTRFAYRSFSNAPSVNQLQTVLDNSNPLQLSTGNPNLRQTVGHFMMLQFNYNNTKTSRNFFSHVYFTYNQDYIGNSTLIAQRDTFVDSRVYLRKGSQLSMPVNMQGMISSSAFATYAQPLNFIKSNVSLTANGSYNRLPSLVNGSLGFSNNMSVGGNVGLTSNISKEVDFNISYNGTYNIAKNTLNPSLDNEYFNHTASLTLNYIFLKNFVLNLNVANTYYTGLGAGFNRNFVLLGGRFGYKFLKEQAMEVSVGVFDALRQNNSVSRSVTDTYIEDISNLVLVRYFTLNLSYKINKFKAPVKPAGELENAANPANPANPGGAPKTPQGDRPQRPRPTE